METSDIPIGNVQSCTRRELLKLLFPRPSNTDETSHLNPSVNLPNPHFTRRNFLKLSALLGGSLLLPNIPLFNTLYNLTRALTTRSSPTEYNDGYDDVFLRTNEGLQKIYDKHLLPLIDPVDKKPILSFDQWKGISNGIRPILAVLYNQNEPRRIRNLEQMQQASDNFFKKYVALSLEHCREFGLHPVTYLGAMVNSGVNIEGLTSQKKDVTLSKFQVSLDALRDFFGIAPEDGNTFIEILQQQWSTPRSEMFKGKWKNIIDLFSHLIGKSEGRAYGSLLSPQYAHNVSRVLSPTIGMMDLEPVIYARAVAYAQKEYPEVFRKVFANHTSVVQTCNNLIQTTYPLESARSNIKQQAMKILKDYPEILADFFSADYDTSYKAFIDIGIGERDFGYSFPAMTGHGWDYEFFYTGDDLVCLSDEDYEQRRKQFVLRETMNYYRFGEIDMVDRKNHPAKDSNKLVIEDKIKYEKLKQHFIADQIFNPKFQAFLEKRMGKEAFVGLRETLSEFKNASYDFRTKRLATFSELGKLEYNVNFQVAISVAVHKMLLDNIYSVYPECNGVTRDQLYWQMYLSPLCRDVSPFSQLLFSYTRPDIDPPYASERTLEAFKEYYMAYQNEALVEQIPSHFQQFATTELQLGNVQEEKTQVIIDKYLKFNPYNIFSAHVPSRIISAVLFPVK